MLASVVMVGFGLGTTALAGDTPAPTLCHLDDDALLTLDAQWPAVPEDRGESLEDRITDHLTDWGNHVGSRMDEMSHHVARLHVDGRARRAQLHLGYGNEHLTFGFDSNILFADGKAYVKAKVELALQGHHFELELPDIDLSRDSYHGEDMTLVNVSVLEKRF
jgi:hypothetical protein